MESVADIDAMQIHLKTSAILFDQRMKIVIHSVFFVDLSSIIEYYYFQTKSLEKSWKHLLLITLQTVCICWYL